MSAHALSGVPAANPGFIARFLKNRARRIAIRATIKELNALSNRELFDIGLTRSEIRRVAEEAYLDGQTKLPIP
jgi:uncharacterized protein YjiS (DUF1127 family)